MSLWTSEELAKATAGRADRPFSAERVVIDSRIVRAGDLFVALKGERFDGHEFVAEAAARGASGLVSQAVATPHLLVADTQKALEDAGRFARRRASGRIVGVTGSVGKTSTKEMLRAALGAIGETYATTGNTNNHIGTPLNLANLPANARFGVFEMGMNHAGEISALTAQVRPHVAIITAVEAVHIEFFDSVAGIAHAKAEIFEGLEQGGTAVLPIDNAHYDILRRKAEAVGARVLTFGESRNADVRLLSYQPHATGAQLKISICGAQHICDLSVFGKHWAFTALATLAACEALRVDLAAAIRAIGQVEEPEGRGRLHRLKGDILLIDDSYNASPASMRAAFAKLEQIHIFAKRSGRKIAALGEMRELGAEAPALHSELAMTLLHHDIAKVYASGGLMKHLYEALPVSMRGAHVAEARALETPLMAELKAGDTLLLKGSHGSLVYQLAQSLIRSYATNKPKG